MKVILALIFLAININAASAWTSGPAKGGRGERVYNRECPPNYFVTGIHGKTGAWIDKYALLCTRFINSLGPGFSGMTIGGFIGNSNGGSFESHVCNQTGASPSPRATGIFSSIYVSTVPNGNTQVLNFIQATCREMDRPRIWTIQFAPNDLSLHGTDFTLKCPDRMYITGFYGQHGLYPNSVGIKCRTLSWRE